MKITSNVAKRFGDIPVGTTFRFVFMGEDKLYLKCCEYKTAYFSLNAVELGDFYLTSFNEDTEVNVVDTELIVD